MKKIAGIALLILGLFIGVIGVVNTMIPPIITSVGFLLIGFVFVREKN